MSSAVPLPALPSQTVRPNRSLLDVAFIPKSGPAGHDQLTKMAVARHLAELLGARFIGTAGSGSPDPAASRLVVPSETLIAGEPCRRLGIDEAAQIFGGIVPHPFVATKVITHPLVRPDATAPAGWNAAFPAAVQHVVLPGYSVFDTRDALQAGERLLAGGAVRTKAPQGVGGSGQQVVQSRDELAALVHAIPDALLRDEGLVLERNLRDVATYSVGQVRVGPWLATYCGTQHLTKDHAGREVYGGSTLTVVRGDHDRLLAQPIEDAQRAAIEQARVYHRAAMACFPDLVATRCNYDAAHGIDDRGRPHAGVLEQSWRIGGASGAEVMALQAFRNDDTLQIVEAETREVYGDPGELPPGSKVYYDGVDSHAGRLVKYAVVRQHGHA